MTLAEINQQIEALKAARNEALAQLPPEAVDSSWNFETTDGLKTLRDLFGDQQELIVIHNMGVRCDYCSLWADGLNGLSAQIETRAAFVVASPDRLPVQAAMAAARGWRFRMVRPDPKFSETMGYRTSDGELPGFSAFARNGDDVVRTGHDEFGPMDEYCAVWPMFARLRGGFDSWEPISGA